MKNPRVIQFCADYGRLVPLCLSLTSVSDGPKNVAIAPFFDRPMKTKLITSLLLSAMLSGCSTFCDETPVATTSVVSKQVIRENNIRGTVTQNWAETMHDTVKVPGQIDPTNTYYRSPHQTVVEIRPGKYSDTKYDNERK